MRVGLIPPRGLENFALQSKFHLSLAIPELMARRTYAGMYKRATELGDYVVLDNGLAEGHIADPIELREHAVKLEVKELVAPDVMKNSKETVEAVKSFFHYTALPIKHMAVAQGRTMDAFQDCVRAFADIPEVNVVGIPRHMLETINSRAGRIDLANWINNNFEGRFELHLLGTNPVWLAEVKMASKYAPFIRSVDTSMPFSYAIEGEELAFTTRPITRPKFYFDIDWTRRVSAGLVRKNIVTLLEWANATGVRSETSAGEVRGVPAL